MYCANCETELPDGAIRCWQCGAAHDPAAPARPQWETCAIRLVQQTGFFAAGGQFLAEARGPGGVRTIATSPLFAPPFREDNTAAFAALQALLGQLEQDGWERTPQRGEEWYSVWLRRRLA